MAKKKIQEGDRFVALVALTSDRKEKQYQVGDVIVAGKDFPLAIVRNWLELNPPAIEPKGG